MLVLGRKYKFTPLEMQKLNKKFSTRLFIKYNNRDPFEVLDELKATLDKNNVHLIVLNTKATVPDEIIKYLTNLQFKKHIKLISIEHFLEKYLKKCYIPDDHTDLNYLENIKPYSSFQYFQKRVIDYLGILTLYILTLPVLMYARRRIKKESPGTSMFKQSRVGLNGEVFKCNKFRSMHLNSYYDPYTRENDNRIFPFGNIMRKTRIDELPQMINVLKGDMHLIGPRAEWNILVEQYEKEIPYYQERHLVRPGITGWAQVNYPYGSNIEDTKQKLMYDLYYIKYWSLWLDIKTAWKTVMVVLGKKGL